jgi:hypothetical protein
MLERRLARTFRQFFEGQQFRQNRERFRKIAAFHMGSRERAWLDHDVLKRIVENLQRSARPVNEFTAGSASMRERARFELRDQRRIAAGLSLAL